MSVENSKKRAVTTREVSLRLMMYAMSHVEKLRNKNIDVLMELFTKQFPQDVFNAAAVREVCTAAGIEVPSRRRSSSSNKGDRVRELAAVVAALVEAVTQQSSDPTRPILSAEHREVLRAIIAGQGRPKSR